MDRGVSPVVAVVLLVGITVLGTAGVGAVALGLDADASSGPSRTIAVTATAADQRITVVHRGGDPIDLHNATLSVHVAGDPLAHQPPVPYFAATGFRGTPTGPFNVGTEPVFDAGERASLQLASTNAPSIEAGDEVRVTIRRDDRRLATATVRAG